MRSTRRFVEVRDKLELFSCVKTLCESARGVGAVEQKGTYVQRNKGRSAKERERKMKKREREIRRRKKKSRIASENLQTRQPPSHDVTLRPVGRCGVETCLFCL